MAALRLIFEARRHCLARPLFSLRPYRLLSSSSSSSSPPPPESDANPSSADESSRRRSPGPVPIEPVSYAVKPKDQSPPPVEPPALSPPPSEAPQRLRRPHDLSSDEVRSTWTREDFRFIKDVPSIAPVSYPSRVAPLPEDKVIAEADGQPGDAAASQSEERRQTDMAARFKRRSSFSRASLQTEEGEKVLVPYPTLIRVEKNERKPILDLLEAIRQVKASAKCNFDETVEAHVRLGVDAKRVGKGIRGSVALPHHSARSVRVAVFAEGKHAVEARAAGADIVGGVELVEEIASSHKLNVEKCFATNEMILRMGKIAKFLRERGLWPDRKLGTVTNDFSEALKKVRQGQIEFKMDKTSIVHMEVGKVSHSEEYIRENIGAFVGALLLAKPEGLKKTSKYAGYINSFHICSTMGPGFPVSIQSISKAADHYKKLYPQ